VIIYKEKLLQRIKKKDNKQGMNNINFHILQQAENLILKIYRNECFSEEIRQLTFKGKESVKKSSLCLVLILM